MSLATVVQRLLSSASESWRSWKTTRCSTPCAESRSGALPSFSARTPRWTSIVASPPSSRIMFAPDSPGHWRICWAHHQYSSSDSPFQANTGTPCGSSTVPFGPTTTAAAAWSWVEKMLQEAHRTSAPSSTSVSMSTAVWMVMCSDPAIRAPARGLEAPYRSRMAIRPGISFSARVISVRPKSARLRSATLKSMCGDVSVRVGGGQPSQRTCAPQVRRKRRGSVPDGCRGLRPGVGPVTFDVDVGLDVDHLRRRLRLPHRPFRGVDAPGDGRGVGLARDADLDRDQQLLGAEVHRAHVDHPLHAAGLLEALEQPPLGVRAGRLPQQQAL